MDTRALVLAFALSPAACYGYSCVAEGVAVATPEGPVPIEQLRVGDRVLSVDVASGATVEVTIRAVRSAERECMSLQVAGGERLVCTPDHPVFDPAEGTYRNAGDWVSGEATQLLTVAQGRTRTVEPEIHQAFCGIHRVFDLTVDGPHHNFVANGIVVHNKSFIYGDEESRPPPYDPGWFAELEAVPCPIPLPDGQACLTVEDKEFHLASATASIDGDRTQLDLQPAEGSPLVYLSFTSQQTADLPAIHEGYFSIVFPDDTRLHVPEAATTTVDIGPELPVPGEPLTGEVKDRMVVEYGNSRVEWMAELTFQAIPVDE